MSLLKNKYIILLIVLIIIELTTRFAVYIADIFLPFFSFIDPEKVFMWGILHHIFQLIIPLLIIFLLFRNLKKVGFQFGDVNKGKKFIIYFSLVWVGIYAIITIYNIIMQNIPQTYYDVTNLRNLFGELFFRGFIVGFSEEIVFRVFPITLLLLAGWKKEFSIFKWNITSAGIISTIIFAYAHIGYNFHPFIVYHFNILQIFTAFGLGLFYAIVYKETKSIYYPIIIHSISDLIPVISLFIISIV